MAALMELLIEKHEKLARIYAHQETSFQYDEVKADGTRTNPNAEHARQSKIAHQETADWLRAVALTASEGTGP